MVIVVPVPLSDTNSLRIECGTRPSMIETLFTPALTAFTAHSTFGIMPPEIIPLVFKFADSETDISEISVDESSLSFNIPAMSVIIINLSAPNAPAI